MGDEGQVYQILISFEAQQEIQEAYDWYEGKTRKLADDFLRALDERFAAIEREPIAHPVVYKQVRRALLRRFPYSLFYFVEEQTIVVVACFHASRDPRQWQRRLSSSDEE